MPIKNCFLVIFIIFILFFLRSYILQPSFKQPSTPSGDILAIFQEYALRYDIDKKSIDPESDDERSPHLPSGFDELLKKIDYFVLQNKPLLLTMVGFPYKSSNTKDKVLISSADAAEAYSLQYLQNFLSKIKNCYSPGIQLYIFTDGIVFCDIEKVSDATVMEYENNLKILSQNLPDIKIVTMRDLCPHKSAHEIRSLVSSMSPSWEEFNHLLESNNKLHHDVDVLTKRMTFELALLSLSDKEIQAIGLQETHRSMQYSNFLKNFRPDRAISCSVHYQKDVSQKIGLKLSESYVTPWHGILIEDDEKMIVHLKDINQSFYHKATYTINGLAVAYLKKINSNKS
jgi:pyoverdine/dityrosine biosynthesis protein Dit1